MQHEGEEYNEVLFPDVHESMLRSDVSAKSAGGVIQTSYCPCPYGVCEYAF